MLSRKEILRLFKELGFHKARICSSDKLPEQLSSLSSLADLGEGSFIMAALSCYRQESDDLSRPGEPHGLIAPFARRNYYKEAVVRLKKIVREIERNTNLSRRNLRIFCNSRMPEKALSVESGLGFYGKNGLVITPRLGSMFVIAGLFLPVPLEPDLPDPSWLEQEKMCGSCRACIEACPVGAISDPGIVDEKRCLQALAAKAVIFPSRLCEAWSVRLYGCQTCQDVCPYNRKLSLETHTRFGDLGPSIPLVELLSLREGQVKEFFRGTQLALSWVEAAAIQRNAILAAGNRKDPIVIPELEACAISDDALLRESAQWALGKLGLRM